MCCSVSTIFLRGHQTLHLPLCVCHLEMKSQGFLCPQCFAEACDIPADCDVCGLMIASSPNFAGSYHHLLPVKTCRGGCKLEPHMANGSASMRDGNSDSNSTEETGGVAIAAGIDGIRHLGRYRCTDATPNSSSLNWSVSRLGVP